jgi:hypothetical protein
MTSANQIEVVFLEELL